MSLVASSVAWTEPAVTGTPSQECTGAGQGVPRVGWVCRGGQGGCTARVGVYHRPQCRICPDRALWDTWLGYHWLSLLGYPVWVPLAEPPWIHWLEHYCLASLTGQKRPLGTKVQAHNG